MLIKMNANATGVPATNSIISTPSIKARTSYHSIASSKGVLAYGG